MKTYLAIDEFCQLVHLKREVVDGEQYAVRLWHPVGELPFGVDADHRRVPFRLISGREGGEKIVAVGNRIGSCGVVLIEAACGGAGHGCLAVVEIIHAELRAVDFGGAGVAVGCISGHERAGAGEMGKHSERSVIGGRAAVDVPCFRRSAGRGLLFRLVEVEPFPFGEGDACVLRALIDDRRHEDVASGEKLRLAADQLA